MKAAARKSRRKSKNLVWKVHVPNLLSEIMNNSGAAVLRIPLLTLANLLQQVASRAIELDDKELNRLMLRLTLYSVADPHSEKYDAKGVAEYLNDAARELVIEGNGVL